MTRILFILTLCLIGGPWCGAGAAEPAAGAQSGLALELDSQAVGTLIGKSVQYLEDPAGRLTLEQVMAMSDRFTPSATMAPNFSFTRSVYWFHLRLENRHSAERRWLIETQYPLIDHYTFYTLRDGKLADTTQAGRLLPFGQRAIKNRNYVFPLEVAQGQAVDLYIRIQTSSSLQLPMTLWTPSAFLARDHEEQYALGLYYGVLVAMLIYNLLIYLSIREISYFNYLHYLGGYILFQMTLNGLAFEYLWPNSPRWGSTAVPALICFALMGMLNFSRTFLNLESHMPRAERLTRYHGYVLGLIAVVSLFTSYGLATKLSVSNSLVAALEIFAIGCISLFKGVRQARYFMLAWTVLLVGIALYALKTFGMVPNTPLTEYGLQIGSALEAILLSFALAQRMTILKEENARIQAEANQQLEQRVAQRTQELDEALKSLSAANAALQATSLIDGLTGIKNRKHFDAEITNEIKRSSRGQKMLSLLLIDIDHFKQVNDQYGHLAGDACLRAVAATVHACLRRPADEVARYGGEEFVVLLPNTDHAGGMLMAEKIRQAVEAMRFEFEGRHIPITISLGCSTVLPDRGCASQALIAAADAALYQAKHSGRNRVCESTMACA